MKSKNIALSAALVMVLGAAVAFTTGPKTSLISCQDQNWVDQNCSGNQVECCTIGAGETFVDPNDGQQYGQGHVILKNS